MRHCVLVTGGAGYIGSHTLVELLSNEIEVIVVDNFCNSSKEALRRVEEITKKSIKLYPYDCCDKELLEEVFRQNTFDAVIHFAGYKAVGESVRVPLKYFRNNLISTLNLLELSEKYQVKNFIFSSSATVYGVPKTVPVSEESEIFAMSPYGQSKCMIEQMLTSFSKAHSDWNIAILRYFNPIGAHPSGKIGEEPRGIPNNLLPYITQVAIGKLPYLTVFGKDYPTEDGTCIRDYIHVCDLACGHLLALRKLYTNCGRVVYNLGTGKGYSVLEVIHAFEEASGLKIPYQIGPRREGDVPQNFASVEKAKKELNFVAKYDLHQMCEDAWRWQQKNPKGYQEE